MMMSFSHTSLTSRWTSQLLLLVFSKHLHGTISGECTQHHRNQKKNVCMGQVFVDHRSVPCCIIEQQRKVTNSFKIFVFVENWKKNVFKSSLKSLDISQVLLPCWFSVQMVKNEQSKKNSCWNVRFFLSLYGENVIGSGRGAQYLLLIATDDEKTTKKVPNEDYWLNDDSRDCRK